MITLVPATVIPPALVAEAGCTASSSSATDASSTDGKSSAYAPRFFTESEWKFVQAAVDQLIPSNQHGAGVPEFIDCQMDTAYGQGKLWYMQGPFHPDVSPDLGYQMNMSPRDIYRHGIQACNAWFATQYAKAFDALDATTRIHVLELLEAGKIELNGVPARLRLAHC